MRRGFRDACHLAVTLSLHPQRGDMHSEHALNLPRRLLRMISSVIKVKFADLSESGPGRGKKNSRAEDMSADSSLANQFEGKQISSLYETQCVRHLLSYPDSQ